MRNFVLLQIPQGLRNHEDEIDLRVFGESDLIFSDELAEVGLSDVVDE